MGTTVAFVMVPLYVVLRQQLGAVGLAIASAVAILTYVVLLGWLQRRRFEREAVNEGISLKDAPGLMDGALRLALAAAIATTVGLLLRVLLLRLLPGVDLTTILVRAMGLCVFGTGIYLILVRSFGVRELAEFEGMILGWLKLPRPPSV